MVACRVAFHALSRRSKCSFGELVTSQSSSDQATAASGEEPLFKLKGGKDSLLPALTCLATCGHLRAASSPTAPIADSTRLPARDGASHPGSSTMTQVPRVDYASTPNDGGSNFRATSRASPVMIAGTPMAFSRVRRNEGPTTPMAAITVPSDFLMGTATALMPS